MDALDASSSLSTPVKYDVFLSFRGEDTRDKFTSHLYAALDRKKIKTYKDDVSLKRGDEISPALLAAIEKSKISIVVFSTDYASSSWCLSELVHILECHRANKVQMVITIFYEVDPSHVRKQEGSYEWAFLKHQERFKNRQGMIQKWRAALTESANLSGWDSRVTKPESKLVEVIVEDVLRKLNRDQSPNFDVKGLIGIDKHIKRIMQLLSVPSPKVCIVGIWGMGGIGKTTLAQVIFRQLSSQFEACCFLANVREESEKGSLINIRNKLLAELLTEENINVGTPSLGPNFVKERLQRTKVLIVLDDVNSVEQLNTFVGDLDQFSCKSRIIITTRDASLLRVISEDRIYEVEQLDPKEALRLFNLIAFRGNSPPTDYLELSKYVVKHVGGVPLAIKVLGSHFRSLRSQSKEAWKAAFNKLKVVPHKDIHNMLRISFDGLDRTEKDIFLDIACFFKKWSRHYVENILDACGFFASTAIDALIDKSLITNKDNRLWMHDLLEEMGQNIVREESKEPGERSRLWIAEDAYRVLENNGGTAKTQGIFLNLSKIEEEIHLEPEVFKKMHNLRLLRIYYPFGSKTCKLHLQRDQCYLPPSLGYLEWHSCPLKSLSRPNFEPKNLVELKMPHSQLEQLWNGVQDLGKLRGIDLRDSTHLTIIPELAHAPNLERIILEDCRSLCQVHLHSLRNLTQLTYVNMKNCSNLRGVPDRIFDAASLSTLTLEGCSNLNTLPVTMATSLVSLNLSSTAIEYLPSSIGSLKNLCLLELHNCKRLTNLPSSLNKLDSLKDLQLDGCSVLEKFPELPSGIQELFVGGTAIKEVASSSIEGCFRLAYLGMSHCKSLECLPTDISTLTCLEVLNLHGCSKLKKLPEIFEPMESLTSLRLQGTAIRQLPSTIGNLKELHNLNMEKCEKLESIPSSFSTLYSLKDLELSYCPNFDYVSFPCALELLDLSNSDITEIHESIKEIYALQRLSVRNCKNLRSLPELPVRLELLDASGCVSLEMGFNSRRAYTREFWTVCVPRTHFMFHDCMKLGKEEQDKIMIDFQYRILRLYKPKQFPGGAVKACYPGNEIPKWFEYQQEGPTIKIKVPGEWYTSDFLGFVLCALEADSNSEATGLRLKCALNFKPSQEKFYSSHREITHEYDRDLIYDPRYTVFPSSNSTHLHMWHKLGDFFGNLYNFLDAEEVSLHFSFHHENDNFVYSSKRQVKKCGIHVLYHQDLEELINDLPLRREELEEADTDLEESNSDVILDKLEPGCGAS